MGVNCSVLDFLLRFRRTGLIRGNCLQLGRQGLHILPTEYEACMNVFLRYDKIENYDSIFCSTRYTENLFKYLGCDSVVSMDYSNYEGSEIIHDMNNPVPEQYHDKYDVIFDGGTIEHIFDVKMSFQNVKKMLKKNGIFISVNGANNHLGHAFYQFSPDLYRTVFSNESGYNIIEMHIAAANLDALPLDITKFEPWHCNIVTSQEQQYINVLVQKVEDIDITNPQQSTYKNNLWN